MYKSGEIYDLMASFEKNLRGMPVYCSGSLERGEKGPDGKWPQMGYYASGETNKLFLAYMWGHSAGRCYERMN